MDYFTYSMLVIGTMNRGKTQTRTIQRIICLSLVFFFLLGSPSLVALEGQSVLPPIDIKKQIVQNENQGFSNTDIPADSLIADAGGPYTGTAGVPLQLDASGSYISQSGSLSSHLNLLTNTGDENTDISKESATADTSVNTSSPLEIISPKGGEVWIRGFAYTIVWSSEKEVGENVLLSLSSDGGKTWTSLALTENNPGENKYEWTIQKDILPALQYQIQVRTPDTSDKIYTATSPDFTIINEQLQLVTPTGGEIWPRGSTQDIIWNALSKTTEKVILSLSADAGQTWSVLTTTLSLPEKNIFEWAIPDDFPLSKQYRLKIQSTETSVESDEVISASDFTICEQPHERHIEQYTWEFGDLAPDVTTTTPTVTHIYRDPGSYNIRLIVLDNEGNSKEATTQAAILQDTQPPLKVTNVTLRISDDAFFSLSWDQGIDNVAVDHYIIYRDTIALPIANGTSFEDHTVQRGHRYAYQISAVDTSRNEGNTSNITYGFLPPQNILPIAEAGEPRFGWMQETLLFDASESYDIDGTIGGYRWDFQNDGVFDTIWSSSPFATYCYSNAGTYTVKLEVKDNNNAITSDTTTVVIAGSFAPPTVDIGGPYRGYAGRSLFFDASNRTHSNYTIVLYHWDFGDNTTGSGRTIAHTYVRNGTYNLTLTITDSHNGCARDSTAVNITYFNSAPERPQVWVSSQENNFVFTVRSSDGDGDAIRFFFDWNDSTNATTPFFPGDTNVTVSKTWTQGGNFTVVIYAEDENHHRSERIIVTVRTTDTLGTRAIGTSGKSTTNSPAQAGFISVLILFLLVVAGILIVGFLVLLKKRNKRTSHVFKKLTINKY